MNYGVLNRLAAATLVSFALASCGGSSDDEAGSPSAFQTVPSAITFQGDGVNCLGGSQQIFVYGGVAPYQIDNTNTSSITLDKSSVGSRGGNFTVTVADGSCMTDIPVVVKDALDHVTTVKVSSKIAKPS
jgi:hypothetical protein